MTASGSSRIREQRYSTFSFWLHGSLVIHGLVPATGNLKGIRTPLDCLCYYYLQLDARRSLNSAFAENKDGILVLHHGEVTRGSAGMQLNHARDNWEDDRTGPLSDC